MVYFWSNFFVFTGKTGVLNLFRMRDKVLGKCHGCCVDNAFLTKFTWMLVLEYNLVHFCSFVAVQEDVLSKILHLFQLLFLAIGFFILLSYRYGWARRLYILVPLVTLGLDIST